MYFISVLIGFTVAFGALSTVWKSHAFRWRKLAAQYADKRPSFTKTEQRFQTVILTGEGFAFASYKGIVTVGIDQEGLTIGLLPPFSAFHAPLRIPFDDILIHPASWYINSSSYSLSFTNVEGIQMITDGGLVDWVTAQSAPSVIQTSWNSPVECV